MLGAKDDASVNDFNVVNAAEMPGDTISSLAWIPNTNHRILACSSWDSKVRLFECVAQNMQKGLVQKAAMDVEDPLLSLAWSEDSTKLFGGCINTHVKAFDVSTGKLISVGKHDSPVKDVFWVPGGANMVMSTSYDKTIRFWDLRQQNPAAGYSVGHKIYCADLVGPAVVLGLSEEKLLVFGLQNMQAMLGKQNLDYIESPLGQGSQLTCVAFFTDGGGVGTASHDGRANLSKLDVDTSGKPKLGNIMTFKCHKLDQGSQQMLYPVHGIGFHPAAKSFVYTAGGEGNIFFWDYSAKNKITGFSYGKVPVTRVKMSPDGTLMAYALGYDWAKGIEGYMSHKPKLAVHMMQESELIYNGPPGK